MQIKKQNYQKSKKHIEYTKRNEYTKHITYDQLKGGNTYEKITHKAVHCNADIDIYSNNEHSGKDKDQLNKTKISLQRGKTYTLKVKGTKKKSKVVKQQENDRNCNKKGKSYSPKARNSSDHSQDRKEEIQM